MACVKTDRNIRQQRNSGGPDRRRFFNIRFKWAFELVSNPHSAVAMLSQTALVRWLYGKRKYTA